MCLHKHTEPELQRPNAAPTGRKPLVRTQVDKEALVLVLCQRAHVSAVVVIVIVYHYSGRGRKIVSTGDMGAASRACSNSWDGEMLGGSMWV